MKLFGILCGKPLQNGFQPAGVGGFCWELLFSLCKKQRQKTQQCSFDDKLIAGDLGTVGIFYFPQAGGGLRIAQIVGGQTGRQRQSPALDREQVFLGANILSIVDAVQEGIEWSNVPAYLIGMAVALVAGIASINLLRYISSKGKFGGFAYYCWVIGVLSIILTMIF